MKSDTKLGTTVSGTMSGTTIGTWSGCRNDTRSGVSTDTRRSIMSKRYCVVLRMVLGLVRGVCGVLRYVGYRGSCKCSTSLGIHIFITWLSAHLTHTDKYQ